MNSHPADNNNIVTCKARKSQYSNKTELEASKVQFQFPVTNMSYQEMHSAKSASVLKKATLYTCINDPMSKP